MPRELNELCYRVVGAAIEVHRALGPGFIESAYEQALALELTTRRIRFDRQLPVPVLYKGQLVAQQRVDFLIESTVVLELKAVESIHAVHIAQMLSYLKAGPYRVGLLINFNVPVLKTGIRRLIWDP